MRHIGHINDITVRKPKPDKQYESSNLCNQDIPVVHYLSKARVFKSSDLKTLLSNRGLIRAWFLMWPIDILVEKYFRVEIMTFSTSKTMKESLKKRGNQEGLTPGHFQQKCNPPLAY